MENSLKGLMLAAGVIITCIVIGLGFYVSREARDTASSGVSQISKLNNQFVESDKIIYDSTEVSGSEVVNVIRKFSTDNVGIRVITKKDEVYYGYEYNELEGKLLKKADGNIGAAQNISNNNYINPNGRFAGRVIRDLNGTIIGLEFKQV